MFSQNIKCVSIVDYSGEDDRADMNVKCMATFTLANGDMFNFPSYGDPSQTVNSFVGKDANNIFAPVKDEQYVVVDAVIVDYEMMKQLHFELVS